MKVTSAQVRNGAGGKMKKLTTISAIGFGLAVAAYAPAAFADNYPIVTKAPIYSAPPPPASCGSFVDFFLTACPTTWYGLSLYGTLDMGGSYQTHGSPFDPNFPTGSQYMVGSGGTGATNRNPGFYAAPNGLSQSNIGIKWNEPVGAGWAFVGQAGLAFDPYSLLLANAPQSMQNGIGGAQNTQAIPEDSSRWGWLSDQIYAGASSGTYGTLTFGRQNTLLNDAIVAYDPMGASYAFSPIGYSGKAAGSGDTEDARWTTAIKYRVNVPTVFGSIRLAVMGQPGFGYGAYNPNQGAVAGGIGGDVQHLGTGVLSVDFFGTWEKDAVNITDSYGSTGTAFGPTQTMVLGWPTTFPAAFLKATISNQTSFMATAKYSFGSYSSAPVIGKAPPAPSGIPLTLYAGYEWIQFANPSDPQSAFYDDGFQFVSVQAATAHGTVPSANGTAINNNSFNANCGRGVGCTDEIFQIIWAGAKYGITKDLDIIGAYYHYIQDQFVISKPGTTNSCVAGTETSANSRCAGWYDAYSVVLDWRFLPKWDVYIGTMYSAAYGAIAFGDIVRNDLSTTAGVRFRF